MGTRAGNAEIYVMNADGSGQTRLTTNPATDGEPSWSPDGTRIAYMSTRSGSAEIYTMSASGSAPARLTTNPAQDTTPPGSRPRGRAAPPRGARPGTGRQGSRR